MTKNHDKTPHVSVGLVGGSLVRGNWGDGSLIRRDNGPRGLTRKGLDGRSLIEALDALATGGLAQSRRWFFWALVAAGIGFIFFVIAALYSMATGNVAAALVPVLAGLMVEAVACLLFYTHGRTTAESSHLRDTLEAVQRHLLANSICEGLSGDRKEQTRADLARRIANIPAASFLTVPSQQSSGDGQT
jgi:hypothetical protein